MLPLLRDQVLIAISPTQLSLLRLRGWFGKRQIIAKHMQAIVASKESQPIWRPALDVLNACLSNPVWQQANAKLTISNSLSRFTLLPWSTTILNADEEQKYVKIRMAAVFGDSNNNWEVSLADHCYGHARLACAMDAGMLSMLRQLAIKNQLNIQSIQPHLVAALNFWQKQLRGKQLRFLLSDGEKLCTTYINHGQLKSLSVEQVSEAIDEIVTSSLQREALMNGEVSEMAQTYMFAPKQARVASNAGQLQKIQRLNLPVNYMHDPAAFLAAGYLV